MAFSRPFGPDAACGMWRSLNPVLLALSLPFVVSGVTGSGAQASECMAKPHERREAPLIYS